VPQTRTNTRPSRISQLDRLQSELGLVDARECQSAEDAGRLRHARHGCAIRHRRCAQGRRIRAFATPAGIAARGCWTAPATLPHASPPYHAVYGSDAGWPACLGEDVPWHRQGRVGLQPVELRFLLGLVFVRVCGDGPSLAEMWGGLHRGRAALRLEEMEPLNEPWIGTWQCNWKVAVDNNLENYHVPIGHPASPPARQRPHRQDQRARGCLQQERAARENLGALDGAHVSEAGAGGAGRPAGRGAQDLAVLLDVPQHGIDIYPTHGRVPDPADTAETCTMRYPIFVRPTSGAR